jgi:hypothetical protein
MFLVLWAEKRRDQRNYCTVTEGERSLQYQ